MTKKIIYSIVLLMTTGIVHATFNMTMNNNSLWNIAVSGFTDKGIKPIEYHKYPSGPNGTSFTEEWDNNCTKIQVQRMDFPFVDWSGNLPSSASYGSPIQCTVKTADYNMGVTVDCIDLGAAARDAAARAETKLIADGRARTCIYQVPLDQNANWSTVVTVFQTGIIRTWEDVDGRRIFVWSCGYTDDKDKQTKDKAAQALGYSDDKDKQTKDKAAQLCFYKDRAGNDINCGYKSDLDKRAKDAAYKPAATTQPTVAAQPTTTVASQPTAATPPAPLIPKPATTTDIKPATTQPTVAAQPAPVANQPVAATPPAPLIPKPATTTDIKPATTQPTVAAQPAPVASQPTAATPPAADKTAPQLSKTPQKPSPELSKTPQKPSPAPVTTTSKTK